METRGRKSKHAKLALVANDLGNNYKHDEAEVQKEEKNKAPPAIMFNTKTHTLGFEETFLKSNVESLKRRVEDKIHSLSMENIHLMKDNKSNEIKLAQILEEFKKLFFELNKSDTELDETKRNLDIVKATMIKTNYE